MILPNYEQGTLYNLRSLQLFTSARKFMLIDLQGAAYNLYDLAIANLELQSAVDQELYLYAGNLSRVTFEN